MVGVLFGVLCFLLSWSVSPVTGEPLSTVAEASRLSRFYYWLTTTRTSAVWSILLLAGIATAFQIAVGFTTSIDLAGAIRSKIGSGEYLRLLSSAFLHASPMHLVGNLIAFVTFGRIAEGFIGNRSTLLVCLVSQVTAALSSYLYSSRPVFVGMSGGLLGLIGVLLSFVAFRKVALPRVVARFIVVAALATIVLGLLSRGNVSSAAHIAGLLVGIAFGWGLSPQVRPPTHTRTGLAIIAGVMVLSVAQFSHRYADTIAEDLKRRAANAFTLKDYSGAEHLYTQAIVFQPQSALAWQGRAQCRRKMRAYSLSIEDYGHAIMLYPLNPDLYLERGEVHALMKNYEVAATDASRALMIRPRYASAFNLRSFAHEQMNLLGNALEDVESSLRIDPNNISTKLIHAWLMFRLGDFVKAESALDAICSQEPTPDSLEIRGVVRLGLGKLNDALKDFTDALAIEPGHVYARARRGDALFMLGDISEAIAEYREALRIDPESADGMLGYGRVALKRGSFAEAEATLESAIEHGGPWWYRRREAEELLELARSSQGK